MVRHGWNKLHAREYSGWRAYYSHVPYNSGNHGRRRRRRLDDRLLRAPARSGPLGQKHPFRREANEDVNGGTTVETRCGYNLRTVPRVIHEEKQKRRNITVISADFTSVHIATRAIWNLNIKKVPTQIWLQNRRRKENKPSTSTEHLENSLERPKTLPETTTMIWTQPITWWRRMHIWFP